MAGTDNFQQWNPTQTNQETDAQYAADVLRSGGATVDAILGSPVFNKFAYQLSTAVKALMDALANKGYTTSDAVLSTLTAQLQNIMTLADMSPYALLASPAFTGTPTAPTAPAGDNSTKVATTAFVAQSFLTAATAAAIYATLAYLKANFAPLNSPNLSGYPTAPTRGTNDNSAGIANTSWFWQQIAYSFAAGSGEPGYVYLPANGNPRGLLIQWVSGTTPITGYVAGQSITAYFSIPFSSVSFYAVTPSHAGTATDFSAVNYWLNPDNSLNIVFNADGLHQYNAFAIGVSE